MHSDQLIEKQLTESVIGAFYEVYNNLGYGFLEHVHAKGLETELRSRRHRVARETNVRVHYKGRLLCTQRIDILVDERLIVEIKSSELLPAPAMSQLRNYLKATNIEVGLLLHFGPKPKFYRQVMSNENKQSRFSRPDSTDLQRSFDSTRIPPI